MEGHRRPQVGPDKGCTPSGAFQGLPGAFSGTLDLSTVDTTPGARCAMAPPTGMGLNTELYRDLMRGRYRNDPGARQHMMIFARRLDSTKITGPWAAEARSILEAIRGDK